MQQNNRRIARNTLYLYMRMAFSMCIKLYTSRVVLQVLGVTDYGLWGVVGGVIAMIDVLNATMTACSNRFITYELGHGNTRSMQEVFSASITIHLLISALVLVLAETVGLWFVETQLVIPPDRMNACRVVYQLTVLCSIANITQVPYNASIMAHERMNVFAYIDMINVLLKLATVYLLLVLPFDKLISLSVMRAMLSLTILMIYRLYCIRKLPSCRFILSHDKGRMLPMLSFSAWDLYGSASVVFRTQGTSMLLNIFFTAVMNAACGIAMSLQSAVMAFGNNVVTAFRPQIVKCYASADYERMNSLIQRALTYTCVLLLLLMLPLMIEMDYVLDFWLETPPACAAEFARLIMLSNLIGNAVVIVNIGIHATGNVKQLSLLNGTIYLLVLPFTWLAFRNGFNPQFPFVYNVASTFVGLVLNLFLLRRLVPAFAPGPCFSIITRLILLGVIVYGVGQMVADCFDDSLLRLLLVVALTSVLTVSIAWFGIFSAGDKQGIRQLIKKRIKFK